VRKVSIGARDVNPRHSGRGIILLRNAGIAVQEGILEKECTQLNETFNKWILTGLPFVIAKCGMSIDGRLTRPAAEPQWITGRGARQDVHRLRARVDAVLVGAETVRSDNPRLTVRGVRGARQPWRVVLTRSGRIRRHVHLFSDKFATRTLVYRGKPFAAVLKDLGKRGITSVLIEGGGEVLGQVLDSRLVDKLHIYLGAILTGGPVVAFAGQGAPKTADALRLRDVDYEQIGQTIRVTGYPDALPQE
jgi:diaminohydroxyphosphoribosylaminopyrimidine deaminase/5-amino-6-(5-phosphoribosylamino)uracil reductase